MLPIVGESDSMKPPSISPFIFRLSSLLIVIGQASQPFGVPETGINPPESSSPENNCLLNRAGGRWGGPSAVLPGQFAGRKESYSFVFYSSSFFFWSLIDLAPRTIASLCFY